MALNQLGSPLPMSVGPSYSITHDMESRGNCDDDEDERATRNCPRVHPWCSVGDCTERPLRQFMASSSKQVLYYCAVCWWLFFRCCGIACHQSLFLFIYYIFYREYSAQRRGTLMGRLLPIGSLVVGFVIGCYLDVELISAAFSADSSVDWVESFVFMYSTLRTSRSRHTHDTTYNSIYMHPACSCRRKEPALLTSGRINVTAMIDDP